MLKARIPCIRIESPRERKMRDGNRCLEADAPLKDLNRSDSPKETKAAWGRSEFTSGAMPVHHVPKRKRRTLPIS